MSATHFDVIVIGTGPAASTVAENANEDGRRVAIVEAREFGGTCALRGCNPKKVYVNAADLIDRSRAANGKLIDAERLAINWPQLLSFKREFTDPVVEKSERSYLKKGMATFHGQASFDGPDAILVNNVRLTADRLFIGSGARPRPLDIPGGERAIHSDAFLELAEIPSRVVFIGGGYISMEFACVVARSGSEVTVLQQEEHVLSPFDADLVSQLVEYSARHGINIHTSSQVNAIESSGDAAMKVRYEQSGEEKWGEADLVVHGAGRIPNVCDLNLKAGEIEYSDRGITVDEFMRSVSNPRVYAAGDCADTGKPMLTPTANEEARIVAKNLFAESPSRRPDYGVIPQVAFTVPAIAAIGLSESEAKRSFDVDVRHADTSGWNSVRKSCQECSGYKVLVDKQTDRILGAHLLGPSAEETINLFALAMKHDLTATDLKSTLFAFPTFASDVRQMV
ncbi:Glutathione amide reductase [Stieleria maiorica]|uniref:Glutathione amide reductase n=1 Tax=Stieleria maiorica TaxID=2795974 RepID=A0A5B9MK88_9BACT|nr:NAD(P)/FAD-dependent oxidoreductase [Stieleria maiorica]QEG01314.1 Glutathione amide reductase [Stieleria maiorica]